MSLARTTVDPVHKAAPDDRESGPTLTIPQTLHVEKTDATSATIYLSDSGARIRIPRKLFELILELETPQTLTSISAGNERVAGALGTLVERGFLVPPGTAARPVEPRLATDPPTRMFDCPAHKDESSASDISIIGVPYDFGDRDAAGARNGPSALRDVSLQLLYRTHRLTGAPLGWYDADSARTILAGVSISDCGDARIVHGEPQATTFDRVSALVENAIGSGALPVVLGGDATVGLPAARALAANRQIGVVQIGSRTVLQTRHHSDFVGIGSLAAMFGELSNVAFVEEISGSPTNPAISSQCRAVVPNNGIPIYLSLDMSAIQGEEAQVGGGWDYGATCSLIETLGSAHPICGIGLLGLNPTRRGWAAAGMTALHLLMQAMDAATNTNEVEKAA